MKMKMYYFLSKQFEITLRLATCAVQASFSGSLTQLLWFSYWLEIVPSSNLFSVSFSFPDYLNNLSPDSKEYEDTQGKPADWSSVTFINRIITATCLPTIRPLSCWLTATDCVFTEIQLCTNLPSFFFLFSVSLFLFVLQLPWWSCPR